MAFCHEKANTLWMILAVALIQNSQIMYALYLSCESIWDKSNILACVPHIGKNECQFCQFQLLLSLNIIFRITPYHYVGRLGCVDVFFET